LEGGRSIAIAGILATAAVGIVGAVSGFLIARSDRSTERALAHDSRVYGRRADAYLDVIGALSEIDGSIATSIGPDLRHSGKVLRDTEVLREDQKVFFKGADHVESGALFAKVRTFGSAPVIQAFNGLRHATASLAFERWSPPPGLLISRDSMYIPHRVLNKWEKQKDAFYDLAHRELS
jgi:hypothetical protein